MAVNCDDLPARGELLGNFYLPSYLANSIVDYADCVLVIILFFLCNANLHSQSLFTHGRLQVSPNKHYLQFADGTTFFWLGDTGWELFHRLTLPEIKQYPDNRAAKGFNVIQAVALAEFEGLRIPNQYGDLRLQNLDPTKPNEKYFRLLDSVVHMESRPMLKRIPANSMVLNGQDEKGEHIEAFHADDYSYAMIYIPFGKTITIDVSISMEILLPGGSIQKMRPYIRSTI